MKCVAGYQQLFGAAKVVIMSVRDEELSDVPVGSSDAHADARPGVEAYSGGGVNVPARVHCPGKATQTGNDLPRRCEVRDLLWMFSHFVFSFFYQILDELRPLGTSHPKKGSCH